ILLSSKPASHKPTRPFVNFSSNITRNERRGKCSIDDLTNFSGRKYQVQLYSDFELNQKLKIFWATFGSSSNSVRHHYCFRCSVEYPHFQVVGKLESGWNVSQLKWLGFLNYTKPGQSVSAELGPQPPPPIASTNVSTVLAGSAFTMKCEMPNNYIIGNEAFTMKFVNNISISDFAYYHLPALSTQQRKRIFELPSDTNDIPYIASVHQMNSTTIATSNTFEIIITTTKKTFSAQYFCWAS
ncbi:hypothetical protein TYRP_017750, partial [Tyrophagus putrescentiae]